MTQMVKNCTSMLDTQVQSLDQEDPLEKKMATHSSMLGASLVAQTIKNIYAHTQYMVKKCQLLLTTTTATTNNVYYMTVTHITWNE